MKPEYTQWAEQLLQDIYYAPEEKRVEVVHEHLLKAVRRGYVDGAENSWIDAQEAAPQDELRSEGEEIYRYLKRIVEGKNTK